jgi:ACDE family multidrug resistance protein
MVLSNSMLIPVLPALQKALHRSLFQVGLLITVFSIAAAVVIPIGGYFSDRYGRKTVIIPCLVIFGAGGLLGGVAPLSGLGATYTLLLIARAIQGIGAGGTYQVAMALAGDIFRSRERSKVLGLLEASNGVGKVVSPIVGAAVMMWTWFAPFFIYPLLAWTSAVLVWRLVDEPEGSRTRRRLPDFVRGLGGVLRHAGGSLLASFFAGALALFFLFGVLSYYADVLEQRYGIDGVTRGLVIAIPVAVMALVSYLSGTFLAKRLLRYSKLVVVLGLALVAAAFVAMFFLHRFVVPFTAAISLMGFGNGLFLPSLNTMITSVAGSRERGTVTALYGTVRFLGAAFGPPAFDKAVKAGTVLPYLGSAALAVLGLAVAALAIRQHRMLATLQGADRRPGAAARPGRPAPRREPGRMRGGNRLT